MVAQSIKRSRIFGDQALSHFCDAQRSGAVGEETGIFFLFFFLSVVMELTWSSLFWQYFCGGELRRETIQLKFSKIMKQT